MRAEMEKEFDYDRYIIEPEGFEKPLKVGVFNYNTEDGSDVEYFHKHLLDRIKSGEEDIIVAPEFSYSFPDRIMSEEEKENYVEGIKDATKGQDVLVLPGTFLWYDKQEEYIHDTAPFISNGEQITEYYKFTDGNMFHFLPEKCKFEYDCPKDKPYNNSEKWMNGEKGGVFKWKENKIGVEICSDHYSGMLKDTEGVKDDLDLQVIVSCGINLKPRCVAVKNGGYAIYCNGEHKPSTKVIKKKGDCEPLGIHLELNESNDYSGEGYRVETMKEEASEYLDIQPSIDFVYGKKGDEI